MSQSNEERQAHLKDTVKIFCEMFKRGRRPTGEELKKGREIFKSIDVLDWKYLPLSCILEFDDFDDEGLGEGDGSFRD